MQNFFQVRVPGGADVKASDAKGVSIPQLPRPWVDGLLRGGRKLWLCLPFFVLLPYFSDDTLYLPKKLLPSNLSFSGCSGGTHTKTSTGDPCSLRAHVLVDTSLSFHIFSQAESAEISPWRRGPTGVVSSPQFSLEPTVCFLLWVFQLCSAPPLVTSLAPNTPFPALFSFIAYGPGEL